MFKLYLLFSVVPCFSAAATALSIIAFIFLCLAAIFSPLITEAMGEETNFLKKAFIENKKIAKWFFSSFIVCVLLACILPSQDDMIRMYVANYVTTNNQIKQMPKVVIEYLKKEAKESE
jgi:hypothetical protein